MRPGDRCTHALGVVDHRLAFAAEAVDQVTDARFVARIGALEFVHFRMYERLELDGASKRALEAFAHCLHLAANCLADHHHAVGGKLLRLGEANGNFGHRLGGKTHFLSAADHHREAPEQDDRYDNRDDQADELRCSHQLLDRADLPQRRLEQHVSHHGTASDPGQREERYEPVDRTRARAAHLLLQRPIVLLAIIVGMGKGGWRRRLRRLEGSQLGLALRFRELGRWLVGR